MRAWLQISRALETSMESRDFVSETMADRPLRIAATADMHYARHSRGMLHEAFADISQSADVLLLCGDLTEYGLPEEAEELVADIRAAVRIPTLAVLGNHDFESSQAELVSKVLDEAGVNVLNGKTSTGIPVYNVSAPALRKTGKPYRIVEL